MHLTRQGIHVYPCLADQRHISARDSSKLGMHSIPICLAWPPRELQKIVTDPITDSRAHNSSDFRSEKSYLPNDRFQSLQAPILQLTSNLPMTVWTCLSELGHISMQEHDAACQPSPAALSYLAQIIPYCLFWLSDLLQTSIQSPIQLPNHEQMRHSDLKLCTLQCGC